MVLLVTTQPILNAFHALPADRRHDLPDELALDAPISHAQIIQIAQYFRQSSSSSPSSPSSAPSDHSLNALLRGTKVYVPPPPPKPTPSPEYLASKARLLAAAEADAYNRMIHPSAQPQSNPVFATSPALNDTISADTDPSADILTPSLVLNIFLSVLITGFSVYWALTSFPTPELLTTAVTRLWSPAGGSKAPSHRASEPVRVLVSLVAALWVGVAEVMIFMIYWSKVADARKREKKLRERREVIGQETVSGKTGDDTSDTGASTNAHTDANANTHINGDAKEAIWGRGPNGGLRRRVREQWEKQPVDETPGEK